MRPVEALVHGSNEGLCILVRCIPEPGDLEALAAGGAVWVTFLGSTIAPFSVDVGP